MARKGDHSPSCLSPFCSAFVLSRYGIPGGEQKWSVFDAKDMEHSLKIIRRITYFEYVDTA